ncbi:retinol dehydrogenase 14-like [Amblyraja radiata]|uniref:retinol dehydrogenase 14-like n=1 Tax=Amblyraja radiata TaxID=386614 RepID=UPI001403EB4B|nr:retinol dehydrogenase 14-like [Amblyraja radiata]
MELSLLLSPLLSLASHPIWSLVCLLLVLVLRSQRRGRWRPANCPVDLSGKTAIVTGANTGRGGHRKVGVQGKAGLKHTRIINLPLWRTDLVKKSPAARIINVSSMNHRRGEVNLRQMRGEDMGTARNDQLYNNTKLMNVLFTHELATQLRHAGVTVNAVHPGVVVTEIMRNYGLLLRIIFNLIGFSFFKSAEEGAVSPIYCSVSQEMEGVSGKYIDSDCSLSLPSPSARDPRLATKLWDVSSSLTGLETKGRGETE